MASVVVNGDTSGAVTLSAPAVAGTVTVTLPSTSGTMAVGGGTITTLTTTSDITVQGLTVGRGAGAVATNTAVGASALASNVSGQFNTVFGYEAGKVNTADNNTFVGRSTGTATTSGEQNTAIGSIALFVNTTGSFNSAVGTEANRLNTTGSNNTSVGYQSLRSNTTASNNTAVGYQAGYNFTTSNDNTVLGYAAGKGVATGQTGIVCLGAYAGAYQRTATGSGVILIGAQADVASAANNFEIVIGYNTQGKGASTGFINPNSGGVYQGNNSSSWSTTSDQRLKKNIADNTDGLSKITAIRVRNFEYRLPEEVTELDSSCAVTNTGVQLGVIAQELQQVLPECVKTESTGVMSVDTDNLTWYMINAIKELKAEFDAYKATHP